VREPLDSQSVKEALTTVPQPWQVVDVLVTVDSTNLEAMRAPVSWRVVVADHQSEGRGRLARQWQAPAGTSVAVSAVVPLPAGRTEDLGWLPLLSGMAMRTALAEVAHVVGRLKWPNDVMVQERVTGSGHGDLSGAGQLGAGSDLPDRSDRSDRSDVPDLPDLPDRSGLPDLPDLPDVPDLADLPWLKISGILCELAAGGALVVIGAGANVGQTRRELPVDTATSLALCGAPDVRREDLIECYLAELARLYRTWSEGGPALEALRAEYRSWSLTIGLEVDVHQPDGVVARGVATGVDDTGRLVVASRGSIRAHAAGDVVHVRPAQPDAGRPA